MGGHQDDLELTFDKPVVSISLGLPAIFLLGGATKNDTPIPILVSTDMGPKQLTKDDRVLSDCLRLAHTTINALIVASLFSLFRFVQATCW